MISLDPTNIAILKELREGRKPFSEIAVQVGVTENTVRARVTRMREEGVLEISGFVDPEIVEGLQVIFVGIKLDTMHLAAKAEEMSHLKGVVSSSVVTGRYDVMLTVLLSSEFTLLDFYTDEISKIDEVGSVETFVVYQGYNLRVPMLHDLNRGEQI